MYEIGRRWQRNEISVAQEHLATASASTVMATCFLREKIANRNGKHAVLACVEGNQHMLGLQMVSDALEINGWDVQFLGANTPSRDLAAFIDERKPELVGLSIAFPNQIENAQFVIDHARSSAKTKSPFVLVGGFAVNRYPDLFTMLGADAIARNPLVALQMVSV